MNLDRQIAKDYLQKLPEKDREDLCRSVLDNLQERKKTKKELMNEYKEFLQKSKSYQKFKNRYLK